MINKNMLISTGLLILCQIAVWFQINGSLKIEWLKNNVWFLVIAGMPLTYLFIYATKIGYEGFGNLWAIRLISFSMGIISFTILSNIFFGESIRQNSKRNYSHTK